MQRTWVEVGRCLLVQLSGGCLQTERRPVLITEPAIALQGVQVLRPIGLYFFAVEFFFAQLVIKGFDHLADDFFCGFGLRFSDDHHIACAACAHQFATHAASLYPIQFWSNCFRDIAWDELLL